MIDILIKNARVLDGSGAAAASADIAVKDGRIVAVGSLDQPANEIIDASGLVAAPGFIDVHGHTDLFAILDPGRASKLCQGITTEICGQCGLGPAPVSDEYYPQYMGMLEGLGAPVYPDSREFNTFGKYMAFMETLPLGINTAYFIPHGMIRLAAMGISSAKPTPEQLDRMKGFIREAMEKGALGLSSGLAYAPGIFADEDELTELCEVVGEYGGIYTTHLRDQGNRVEQCVEETIRVAKKANVRANVSHHKASGKDNWGKVASTIKMIHDAGIPAAHDVYPYAAASSTLLATLPPYLQRLPHADIIAYLCNKENHGELENAIFNPSVGFESPLCDCGYDGLIIFHAATTSDAVGKSVKQYGREKKLEPFDAYLKLLIDNGLSAGYIGFSMAEADVAMLLADPLCMFGTDALYVEGMPMTHPRAIGTFPRILGRYVREAGQMTLEEAVRKMTSLPAQFYGLSGKGLLRKDMDADIVIFDPVTIYDHADYRQPLLPNAGIYRVIVGGKVAVVDDKPSGERNGKVLKANTREKLA